MSGKGRIARRRCYVHEIPTRKTLGDRGEAWDFRSPEPTGGSGSGDLRVFDARISLLALTLSQKPSGTGFRKTPCTVHSPRHASLSQLMQLYLQDNRAGRTNPHADRMRFLGSKNRGGRELPEYVEGNHNDGRSSSPGDCDEFKKPLARPPDDVGFLCPPHGRPGSPPYG